MLPLNVKHIPKSPGSYIVGGSIRDLLLGRSPADYDIACHGNPEKFAQKIAATTQGRLVKIGKPGQTIIRVVTHENTFDITPISGSSIEADLKQRDFTVNSLAYSLFSGEIIDCTGGMQDLEAKRIRKVSGEAFKKDPVRLLRAFRMGACLGFEIEPGTESAIRNDAGLIRNSAGERIRTELLKMLGAANSHPYMSRMADTGLLFSVFPELCTLRGCFQNRHHRFDALEHTLKAFFHLETLLNGCDEYFPENCSRRRDRMPEEQAALLKCAMLLHDIGKPSVRSVDSEGSAHFFGHGRKSADMAKTITSRLKFSTRQACFVDFIIRNHMRPLALFMGRPKTSSARISLHSSTRFFIKCGDKSPDLLLHAMADYKGKGNESDETAERFIRFATKLLYDYYSVFKPLKSHPPLVTGADLINEFGLTPSPLFKTILDAAEAARLSQNIRSRPEALKFVKELLENRV